MKRLVCIICFVLLVPLDFGISLWALNRVSDQKKLPVLAENRVEESAEKRFPAQVYASLPKTVGEVHNLAKAEDARPVIIEKYLRKYKSPMKPYPEIAQKIVEVSDELGLDWRLLVAIAQQESNLGKKMPKDCYNSWGYGIHSRGTLCFDSWEEGIEKVAKGLKKRYVQEGLDTPEEIMSKYTPLSSGSWARGVSQFLGDLQKGVE